METRVYDGHLVVDGQETGPLRPKVLLSTGNEMASGAGRIAIPLALVGAPEGCALRHRTDRGGTIDLVVSEIDPAGGYARFLTRGGAAGSSGGAAAGIPVPGRAGQGRFRRVSGAVPPSGTDSIRPRQNPPVPPKVSRFPLCPYRPKSAGLLS